MNSVFLRFESLCKAYGFSKTGEAYCRCIGDGVFQTISQPSFPHSHHKFTKCSTLDSCIVSIGMRSIFSKLHNEKYSDLKYICEYFPQNFIGSRFDFSSYHSLDEAIGLLESTVFPFLDSISTQKELIAAVSNLDQIQFGVLIPHRIELVAPYLICGKRDQALMRLYGMYAQNWLNFRKINNYLKQSGNIEGYISAESHFEKEIFDLENLLTIVSGNKEIEICDFLLFNLKNNIIFAKDNNILISDSVLRKANQILSQYRKK